MALLVFDFDGTLVDSNEIKLGGFALAASILPGGSAAAARILADGPRGDRYETIARIVVAAGAPDAAAAVAGRYDAHVRTAILERLSDGWAASFLAGAAAAGHRLWVNSATPSAVLQELLAAASLDAVLAGWRGGFGAKTANLRAILETEIEVPVAVIGDGVDDQASARECGCIYVPVDDRDNALFARPPASALAWIEARIARAPAVLHGGNSWG